MAWLMLLRNYNGGRQCQAGFCNNTHSPHSCMHHYKSIQQQMQHNMLSQGTPKAEYLAPRPLALRPLPRSGLSPLKRASPSGTCWKGCPSLPAGASLHLTPHAVNTNFPAQRIQHDICHLQHAVVCIVCHISISAQESFNHLAQFGNQVLLYSLNFDEVWLVTRCIAQYLPRPRPRPLPLPRPLSAMARPSPGATDPSPAKAPESLG